MAKRGRRTGRQQQKAREAPPQDLSGANEMPSAFPEEQSAGDANSGGRIPQVGTNDTTAFRDAEEGVPDMSKTFGLSDDASGGDTLPDTGPESMDANPRLMELLGMGAGADQQEDTSEPVPAEKDEAEDSEEEPKEEQEAEETDDTDKDYLFRTAVERGVPPGRAKALLEKGALGDFLDALQAANGAKAEPDATPGQGGKEDPEEDPVAGIKDLSDDVDETVQEGWKQMKETLRSLHRENKQLRDQVTLIAGHVNESAQERAVRDLDHAVSQFGDTKSLGEEPFTDLPDGSPQQKRRVEIATKANVLWQAYQREGVNASRRDVFRDAIRLLGYEKRGEKAPTAPPRQPTRMNRPNHREELPASGDSRAEEIIRQGLAKFTGQ